MDETTSDPTSFGSTPEGPCPVFLVRSSNGPLEMSGIIETKTFTVGSGKRPENNPSPECPPIPYGITYCTDRTSMVHTLKENLKHYEQMFKRQYSYGPTGEVHYTAGYSVRSLEEPSSGIPWAAVYGCNEICVVTLTGHVDWKRVRGCLASRDSRTLLSIFRKCVLSELEDLADPSSELSLKLKHISDVPFCAASDGTPIPDESNDETSSVEYFPHSAISCINVRKSVTDSLYVEDGGPIKMAMEAFGRLLGRKYIAEEIEATVVSNRRLGYPTIKDLDSSEIEYYFSCL